MSLDLEAKDESDTLKTILSTRFILDLTREEKEKFLNSFDIVICDCDGVIWDIHEEIKGAGKGINALKLFGKKFIYVSNNSIRLDSSYVSCFHQAGVETDLNDVFHPVKTTIMYLKQINFVGLIYCVATAKFKNQLRQAGYQVIDGPNKILDESYSDLAKNVFDKEKVAAVIVDVDFNLSAAKLIRADLYLRNNPDCIFLAGATDVKLPVGKGVHIIGPGPYVKVVEEASGKRPIILGKPGKDLGDFLIRHYNIANPNRVLVIGDMLEQDIQLGKKCGFQTLVVLTGGCTKAQLCNRNNEMNNNLPDYFAHSIADFVNFVEGLDF